jgi:hypothetical protein
MVNIIGEYFHEKMNSTSADFVILRLSRQQSATVLSIISMIFVRRFSMRTGRATGAAEAGTDNIKRDACRIMTEMVPISPLLSVTAITFASLFLEKFHDSGLTL